MPKWIEKYIILSALKEEFRRIGGNFITAGIVGIFIYHYVGTDPVSMFWASILIAAVGLAALYYGVKKYGDKK